MFSILSQTLQQLVQDGRTSAREIGDLIGVSPSTVYRWINGESEPDFNSVRRLLRHLPDRRAQQAILTAMIAETPWQVQWIEADLDVNGDGVIGPDDALDSAIKSVQSATESLMCIRDSCRTGTMSHAEAARVIDILSEVVVQCSVTQQVVTRIASPQRRKARQEG